MDINARLNENRAKLDAIRRDAASFISSLTDDKSFVETGTFVSGKGYSDGVEAEGEGIITGYAAISDIPVYLFVQNFSAMRGSFSEAQAKKIENAMKMAAKAGIPFISVIDSAGARVDEGAGVLEAYARIIRIASEFRYVIPHIAVVKGACVGLMSAFAQAADFVLIDKKGTISFEAPSVAAAKAEATEPADKLFGAGEALKCGAAGLTYDGVADLKAKLTAVLGYFSGNADEGDNPNRKAKGLKSRPAYDEVFAAVSDNARFLEIDAEYGAGVKTAFSRVNGFSVGMLSAKGMLNPVDLKKITKFAKLLDGFGVPLLTFVDSEGFSASCVKCARMLPRAAADAFSAIAILDSPKIAVITGNAIGAAYALLASKGIGFDYSVAFSDASIAPLSAEQAVNFFAPPLKGKDPIKARELLIADYTAREGNPFVTAKDGYIDDIISADETRPYISGALQMLL